MINENRGAQQSVQCRHIRRFPRVFARFSRHRSADCARGRKWVARPEAPRRLFSSYQSGNWNRTTVPEGTGGWKSHGESAAKEWLHSTEITSKGDGQETATGGWGEGVERVCSNEIDPARAFSNWKRDSISQLPRNEIPQKLLPSSNLFIVALIDRWSSIAWQISLRRKVWGNRSVFLMISRLWIYMQIRRIIK